MDIPHIKDGIGIMGKGCVSRQVVLSHCDLEKANDLSDGKVGSCMLVLLLSLVLVAHGRAQLVKPLARGPLCDSSPCHSGTPLRDSSCEVWKRKCRRDSASTTRCATWLATSSQCHGCVEDHSETWFGPRRSCRVAWLIFRHDLGGQGVSGREAAHLQAVSFSYRAIERTRSRRLCIPSVSRLDFRIFGRLVMLHRLRTSPTRRSWLGAPRLAAARTAHWSECPTRTARPTHSANAAPRALAHVPTPRQVQSPDLRQDLAIASQV